MSEYALYNIEVIKGATFNWNITMTDENAARIDLSGVSQFVGSIRKRKQDSDTLASFTFTITNAGQGEVNWGMTDETTGTLPYGTQFYEVFQENSNGTRLKIFEGEAKVI